jgi:hypothetical protein
MSFKNVLTSRNEEGVIFVEYRGLSQARVVIPHRIIYEYSLTEEQVEKQASMYLDAVFDLNQGSSNVVFEHDPHNRVFIFSQTRGKITMEVKLDADLTRERTLDKDWYKVVGDTFDFMFEREANGWPESIRTFLIAR